MVSREIWGKTCTHEFFKNAQIALVLRTRAILYVFEKLTRACFSQIALEIILLPIQIARHEVQFPLYYIHFEIYKRQR